MTVKPRHALTALAGAAALAALGAGIGAQAQLMRGHNSNAPVDFSADRIEVQDRADRVVLSGSVHVVQADLILDSARMTVAYRNGDGVKVDRIDASGSVHVTRGSDTATGDVAIYDLNSKIITMLGKVVLTQGTDRLTGGRLIMDLNSGLSTVDGRPGSGGGGRVSGTFSVPQRTQSK